MPVLPRQRPRAGPPRMRGPSVPSRPAIDSESENGGELVALAHRQSAARPRGRARRGCRARGPSRRPARAAGRRAAARSRAARPAPRRGGAAAAGLHARSFTSISAKKLSEGLLVSAARRAMVGDSTVASSRASAGRLPGPGRAADGDAAPLERVRRAGRPRTRAGWPDSRGRSRWRGRGCRTGRSAARRSWRSRKPESGPPRSESKRDSSPYDAAGHPLDAGLLELPASVLDRARRRRRRGARSAGCRRWGRPRPPGTGCRGRCRPRSSSPSPRTSVSSVPSVPKRARAAAVVKSLVFEARIRGVLWRQRKTALPVSAFST